MVLKQRKKNSLENYNHISSHGSEIYKNWFFLLNFINILGGTLYQFVWHKKKMKMGRSEIQVYPLKNNLNLFPPDNENLIIKLLGYKICPNIFKIGLYIWFKDHVDNPHNMIYCSCPWIIGSLLVFIWSNSMK